MEITPSEIGPVALLQIAAGAALPVRAKLITPAGARALLLPVTVAVKVMEPPKVGVEELVSTRVGVAGATTVALDEIAPTAL